MPGASAATQSSRCGKRPNSPSGVWATTRDTFVLSTKTWKGRRTLRFMGSHRCGFRLRRGLFGLTDCPDHVESALGVVLELVAQNALTAIERVFEAYELPLD